MKLVSKHGAMTLYSLKAGMTSKNIVPGLFNEHSVERQHMEPNLDQNILEHNRPADQYMK